MDKSVAAFSQSYVVVNGSPIESNLDVLLCLKFTLNADGPDTSQFKVTGRVDLPFVFGIMLYCLRISKPAVQDGAHAWI